MILRAYRTADCEVLAALFYDTVHSTTAQDYTEAQRNAWATGSVDLAAWDRSFRAHDTVVAVEDGTVIGFGDLDNTGYLDRLFVRKNYQRQGVATAICDRLEQAAGQTITTHASITARPFFEKRGYIVVQEQQVERHGVLLTNFLMKKQ